MRDSLPGFSWLEPGKIAGMADPSRAEVPRTCQLLEALRVRGVGAIVSLTEEGLPAEVAETVGLDYLHVPVPDMGAPTLEEIQLVTRTVAGWHAQGVAVVVHCGAGLGRTGTMLAAYLVSRRHPAEDAIALVRQLRPGSIETVGQEDAVRRYACWVQQRED